MLVGGLFGLVGSSPRMRGTHLVDGLVGLGRGIIPAYAGNTGRWLPDIRSRRDHPRVCGEHQMITSAISSARGSSPRMRGTRAVSSRMPLRDGIIPAYAGNTHTNNHRSGGAWDHPRVCGEHFYVRTQDGEMRGSSPRMRGTPVRLRNRRPVRGIIPAYAGNTQCARMRSRFDGDHPRVCGEHLWRR